MGRRILLGVLSLGLAWAGWSATRRYIETQREETWSKSFSLATSAISHQNNPEAEGILVGMLDQTEKWWPHDHHLAETLKLLGTTYLADHDYEHSELYLHRAFLVYDSYLPAGSIDVANMKTDLGMTYGRLERFKEAEQYFAESLAIFEKNPSPGNVNVALDLQNLAFYCKQRGQYAQAESLIKRAVEAYQADTNPAHAPGLSFAFADLAEIYRLEGKTANAEEVARASIAREETAGRPESALMSRNLNELSLVVSERGRESEAAKLLARSDRMDEKLGLNSLNGSASLNNRALAAMGKGNYTETESLFKQAIAQSEKEPAADKRGLALELNNLATLYRDEAQFDMTLAEPLFRRALAIREDSLGPEHPETAQTLSDMALLYFYEERYADAEVFAKRALPGQEKFNGPESYEISLTLNRLGISERNLGKFEEAEVALKRALAIREKHLSSHHPAIATSLENLASLYAMEGKMDKAAALLARAQAIREHPDPIAF